jgi:hypothetical protein
MILCDTIDYASAKVHLQKGGECAAFTFFTVVAEHIQQKYGEVVDFDIYKHFESMKVYEANVLKTTGIKKRRMRCLLEMARAHGFRTKDGRLVKVKWWKKMRDPRDHNQIRRALQLWGPVTFMIRYFKGHDLQPRGDIIGPVPEGANSVGLHEMVLRGCDFPNRLYKFQNSWGDNSIKYVPFEVYEDIVVEAYAMSNVILIK